MLLATSRSVADAVTNISGTYDTLLFPRTSDVRLFRPMVPLLSTAPDPDNLFCGEYPYQTQSCVVIHGGMVFLPSFSGASPVDGLIVASLGLRDRGLALEIHDRNEAVLLLVTQPSPPAEALTPALVAMRFERIAEDGPLMVFHRERRGEP